MEEKEGKDERQQFFETLSIIYAIHIIRNEIAIKKKTAIISFFIV